MEEATGHRFDRSNRTRVSRISDSVAMPTSSAVETSAPKCTIFNTSR